MGTDKAKVNGVDIAFSRRGSGPPMVLLHGYPLDRSIWDRLAPLLEHEFEMIIPDLRGFGGSELADTDESMATYASDIVGLMDVLGMRQANIVGHSMGGYVALAFVRKHPGRTAGIGLVSSQTLPDTAERKKGRYEAAKKILAEGVQGVAEAMAPQLTSQRDIQEALRGLISRQRPGGLAYALEAMAERPDTTDVIASFKKPVVVVHGDADKLIPVERGREIKTTNPAAHYVELAGAGHMPMMENPAAVADALKFFLGKPERAID